VSNLRIEIKRWMVSVLKLTGNELIFFAYIYGLSDEGNLIVKKSLNDLKKVFRVSKTTVISLKKKLEQKGFLIISGSDFSINDVIKVIK